MQKKIKIACLHGFGTNADFLSKQMSSFEKLMGKHAEFVYLEGKIETPKAFVLDQKVLSLISGETKSWAAIKSYQDDYDEYVKAMLDNFKDVFEQGGHCFDGILGFSQGAVMVHALMKFQQAGIVAWKSLQNIKFCILVCGNHWTWRNTQMMKPIPVPSLHLISTSDFLFRKSMFLPVQFKNSQILYHSFGHRFPKLGAEDSKKILGFIKKSVNRFGKQVEQISFISPKM